MISNLFHILINNWLNVLIVLHFASHAMALIGAWTFFHSYKEHKHSKWKLVVAILWFIIAVAAMVAHAQEKC